MRQKFEQQLSCNVIPISEVIIPLYKRDELPPTLLALQHIFITPELNREVFLIMEDAILSDKKKTGRTGMDLWHILVLAVVRLTLGINYDRLWHTANYDKLVRKIMGIEENSGWMENEEKEPIPYNTIRENVGLLDAATLNKISAVVVKSGHQLLKKKEEKLSIKVDTYVVETNVHFPTDINLLWDAARKDIDMIEKLATEILLGGWRKIASWKRDIKNQFRTVSKVCQSGGKDKAKRVLEETTEYLRLARYLVEKIQEGKELIYERITTEAQIKILIQLDYYVKMTNKHIDLVERRLIKGETIAHADKLFSIFEPHSEWIKKGKSNNKVEIGHNVLVATDQFQFVNIHKVIESKADVELAIPLADMLLVILGEGAIDSLSFDKGFYKKENKELLQLYFDKVVMPKKGKKNSAEQEEETTKEFKKLRNKHSAVESNINSLEHHGLNRCPDKGITGFIKYVALGVLAYNLHIFGNALMAAKEKKERERKRKRERELLRQAA